MTETSLEPAAILDFLLVGDQAHAKDRKLLRKLNITHIINCTPTRDDDPVSGVANYFEKERQWKYLRCSMFDNKGENMSRWIEASVAFITEAKFHGKVLVHCNRGISRSCSIVIAYLMQEMEFRFQEALAFVVACRPQVGVA